MSLKFLGPSLCRDLKDFSITFLGFSSFCFPSTPQTLQLFNLLVLILLRFGGNRFLLFSMSGSSTSFFYWRPCLPLYFAVLSALSRYYFNFSFFLFQFQLSRGKFHVWVFLQQICWGRCCIFHMLGFSNDFLLYSKTFSD